MKSSVTASIIMVAMLLMVCMPFVSDTTDADDSTTLFSEVNPFGSYEGFSLYNYGNSTVNLKDYTITDRECTISITVDIKINPSTRVTFVANIDSADWFSSRSDTFVVGSPGIEKKGTFALANDGDDLYLYKGNTLIDTVCYGKKNADSGWTGPPVEISSNKYILRTGVADTNSASDWILTKFGLTNLPFDPSLRFDAIVTPFTFPDGNGGAIYKEIENAKKEIVISIYQLTSYNLVSLLCEMEGKGVDVIILLEGDVLNYDMSNELSCMKSIKDAGGEVYLINTPAGGNYERYSFVHNKYAIIDSEVVIITSENWTIANMGPSKSNRGWGAIIESKGYAEYMRDVFDSDMSQEYGDVFELTVAYPQVKPYGGLQTYVSPVFNHDTGGFSATVTPILSPDNSYSALHHYMENAEYRLFSQQLDIGSTFANISDISPVSWMSDAADRGVDARFILDIATSGNKESHTGEVNIINTTTNVKATTINGGEGFSVTHNKGIIIDDAVWVGSVNWTENSFMNNRESAVFIHSKDVADYYAGYFLKDWDANTTSAKEITISPDKETMHSSEIVTFTVSDSTSKTYTWDIYGDGTYIRTSGTNRIACDDLVPGEYTMRVTLDDGRVANLTYAILSAGDDDGGNGGDGPGLSPTTIIITAVIASALVIIAIVARKVTR